MRRSRRSDRRVGRARATAGSPRRRTERSRAVARRPRRGSRRGRGDPDERRREADAGLGRTEEEDPAETEDEREPLDDRGAARRVEVDEDVPAEDRVEDRAGDGPRRAEVVAPDVDETASDLADAE